MKKTIVFTFAFLLWMLLVASLDMQNVAAGAVVALITALLFGNYFAETPEKF
ncbi:Na+/H+ antiporter subunit E, partial [bacterium]|nr:Na+/H+ antiporter subunit E [bacterium]